MSVRRIAAYLVTRNGAFFERVKAELSRRLEVLLRGPVDEAEIGCILQRHRCDVLLIDAACYGNRTGPLLRRITGLSRSTKALLFYATCTEARVDYVLHCGGSGCVPATASAFELIRAIQAVDAGELWASRRALASAIRGWNVPSAIQEIDGAQGQLSRRESEIVGRMVTGMSNKEIARELGISDLTVKTHAQNIFHKLEIAGRVELMALNI